MIILSGEDGMTRDCRPAGRAVLMRQARRFLLLRRRRDHLQNPDFLFAVWHEGDELQYESVRRDCQRAHLYVRMFSEGYQEGEITQRQEPWADIADINARGQVASIPRRVLDPRRPKGKPTSADKEEMLLPYDSVVPIDSKRVISHTYPVRIASSLTPLFTTLS